MKKLLIGIFALLVLMAFFPVSPKSFNIEEDSTLAEIEEALGKDFSLKKPKNINGVSALVGEDIVKYGSSKRPGEKKAKRQSKHFECIACHNLEREDPNLAFTTPEARLSYTSKRGLPFLQATTLYGAVNRDSYYNGDYEKKYGDLVTPARNDIREAIQLCATECAQGRRLKDWELESVLAYLWTIGLTVADLEMAETEINSINEALQRPPLFEEALKFLANKYSKEAGATFLEPPKDRKKGVGLNGNPENGQLIYNNSCLHCHYGQKYSFLLLDNNKMSYNYLDKKADTYSMHSIYQVVRYGTYSKYGKMSYMPNYTAEKMSEQQLADLRAYISKKAKE